MTLALVVSLVLQRMGMSSRFGLSALFSRIFSEDPHRSVFPLPTAHTDSSVLLKNILITHLLLQSTKILAITITCVPCILAHMINTLDMISVVAS